MKNDDKIIMGLLTCSTIRDAAEYSGVSERTVYNRLSCPEFAKKLAEERRKLFKAHSTALQGQIGRSIATIVQIRDSTENPSQVRLNAADSILRYGFKVTEQADIIERIEELEKMVEDA